MNSSPLKSLYPRHHEVTSSIMSIEYEADSAQELASAGPFAPVPARALLQSAPTPHVRAAGLGAPDGSRLCPDPCSLEAPAEQGGAQGRGGVTEAGASADKSARRTCVQARERSQSELPSFWKSPGRGVRFAGPSRAGQGRRRPRDRS